MDSWHQQRFHTKLRCIRLPLVNPELDLYPILTKERCLVKTGTTLSVMQPYTLSDSAKLDPPKDN